MHTKLLTLRYSRRLGSFDDEVLERLQAGCEIQTVSDHYFEIDGVPHLALVVTYSMAAAAREAGQPARLNRADSGGYKTILREEDGPLFEALREWRSRAAQKQGQARFVLFTNAQLARIARARPESKTALGQIDGVGKSRLEKFGDDVLRIVRCVSESVAQAGGDGRKKSE